MGNNNSQYIKYIINNKYIFKKISTSTVQERRAESHLTAFNTTAGSSNFQIMIFKTNWTTCAAADRIYLCQQCKDEHGSCSLFQDFYLPVTQLKETSLQSTVLEFNNTQQGEKPLTEFILANSVWAFAAESKSSNTLWFLLILEQKVAESNEAGDYGHIIPEGWSFISGHYLEKYGTVRKG